jgi:hypothetical protein
LDAGRRGDAYPTLEAIEKASAPDPNPLTAAQIFDEVIMRTTYSLALGALLLRFPGSEPVTISLTIGGKEYKATGDGTCNYAPMASYYDMRAKMWSVEYTGEAKSGLTNLTLTVWRPLAGGADQMSLSVRIGSADHRIDTVKKSQNVGSGTLKLKPTDRGGIFEIDGKDDTGATMKGTVECAGFSSPPAVAG